MKILISMIAFFALSLVAYAQDLTGQITIIWNKDASQSDKNKIKKEFNLRDNDAADQINLESLYVTDGADPKEIAEKLSHEAAVNSATPGGITHPPQDEPQQNQQEENNE